ncbi:transglutaminase-like domain-containing protein [Geodermatophilus marinus]|uniref:transglutaminase-like domain-containing protein n=1 Tax=Geodermatophilus sp. LHW52908 TaxID=2303986 RepID=UPI001F37809E|nr:transglutaminase family protein [Geodermatophilus sp. LHW52908]
MLCDGRPLDVEELAVGEARVHRVRLGAGTTTVAYTAAVDGDGPPRPVTPAAWAEALRPSRYCPSDELEGFATAEFDRGLPRPELVAAVAGWVHDRLTYSAGASRPVDTAVDTLLAGRGVCRDYAHLTATLLRALEVPARLVAVYAPGLDPDGLPRRRGGRRRRRLARRRRHAAGPAALAGADLLGPGRR